MRSSRRCTLLPILGLLVLLVFSSPAAGLQLDAGQSVHLPGDETVAGSYLVAAQTVEIDGRVEGDLFCAAQTIRVTGTVEGDVLCAGQTLTVDGTVRGDLRAVGQDLSVSRTVARNVTAAAQVLNLSRGSSVGGELIAGGRTIHLRGIVGGDVLVGARAVDLDGRVQGDVSLNAGELSLGPDARVDGNLNYTSNEQLPPDQAGRVRGSVRYTAPAAPAPERPEPEGTWTWVWWLAGWLYSLVSFFVMGLLFLVLWPGGATIGVNAIREGPGFSLVWGLVVMAVPPVLALLLTITVVGVPLAVVLVLSWVCLLLLSPVMTGMVLGDWVLNVLWEKRPLRLYGGLALGVALLWMLFAIPYLGTILYLVATLLGLGGLFQSLRRLRGVTGTSSTGEEAVESP